MEYLSSTPYVHADGPIPEPACGAAALLDEAEALAGPHLDFVRVDLYVRSDGEIFFGESSKVLSLKSYSTIFFVAVDYFVSYTLFSDALKYG